MGISLWQLLIIISVIVMLAYTSKLGRNKMNIKPKSAIGSVLLAVVIYFFIGSVVAEAEGSVIVYLIYIFFAMVLTYALLKSDISNLDKESNTFKKVSPFDKYGTIIHEFQYSFKADSDDVITETRDSITKNLQKYSGFSEVKVETITDIDKELKEKDSRDFVISQSEETLRGGKVSQLIKSDNTGNMYSIKWWFILSGVITNASIIRFIAFSPLSMPFWIISRLKGDHDLALNIRDIYPAYYESHDLLTIVNSANKLTMEILIKELSDRGIDTSDLKMQQAQAMNISISGGNASFGSIVQGAMNNINAPSGGSK